jgi:hypothetical protein
MRPVVLFVLALLSIITPQIGRPHGQSPVPANALLSEQTRAFRVSRPGVVSIPLSALPNASDPATIHLWRRGVEIPIQVDDDTLQFVARASDSPFSAEAVYWLTSDTTPGLRTTLPPLIAAPLTWEQDAVYQPVAPTDRSDRWFAGELRAGGGPIAATLTLPTAAAAGTSIELHVTPLVRRSAHWLRISHAGAQVGTAAWDDGATYGPRTLTVALSQPLPAGRIQLDLSLISKGQPEDVIFLDRLELPGVRVPLPMLPTPQLAPVTSHDLRGGPGPGQAGASFLIITHGAFRSALDPLIAAHRQRGDTVGVVDAQAVYDTFSYGERDPEAIRDFIRAALASWRPAPRAVLLVGAGSVRMRVENNALDPTFIPPYLIDADPKYGEIACDGCYARVTQDVRDQLVPSVPVGRFPARTLAEARILVGKTVAALTAPPLGEWRARALALADNDYEADGTPDRAGSFVALADEALALLPDRRSERFYYAPDRATAAPYYHDPDALRRDFFASFDDGAALVLYAGHASPWQWAFTSPNAAAPYLVGLYDADARTNAARLPVLLSMGCLSGNWANPTERSLDERLLLAGGGGIVASLSPVGSGVNTGHRNLLAGAAPALARSKSLGEAYLAGMASVANTGRDVDLLFTFGILGDPDVALPRAQESVYLPMAHRSSS